MDNSNPEKIITAVYEASKTLESKGVIDRQFPDLQKTFTDPPIYNTTLSDAAKPVKIKQSISFPANALNEIKQYNPNSPCGFAPLINRAYFVIKNKLYLWEYSESRDFVVHEEEDDIFGVGFVQTKPNIFKNDVKYLLIISTAYETKIIALVYDRSKGLQIFKTGMATNNNGVNMTQIVGTKFGRVFMLGNDGNVWELDYKSEETWFSSKCSKKFHSSDGAFSFLTGQQRNRVIQIVANESGTVLYQLTDNNNIYVSYLGRDDSTFNTVFKHTDIYNEARRSNQNTIHLKIDNFKIVSIHPTSNSESIKYNLVAVTSTGCRIYYSHHKGDQHLVYDASPNSLVTVHVRPPSNYLTTKDIVSKAIYTSGLLLIVKKQPAQDKLVTFSPDLGNLANCTSVSSDIRLLELSGELDIHSRVLAMTEAPKVTYNINEFKSSYNTPARHVLVLTTSGIYVLEKQRPIDTLYNLLMLAGHDTNYRIRDFESFFSHFGFVNSCSLCFSLVCYGSSILPQYNMEPVPEFVEQGAKVLLERFGQVPSILNNNSSSQYTSRHDGLSLFIYRVLGPVWSKTLVKQVEKEDGTLGYQSNISTEELKTTQQVLRKLSSFMKQNSSLFPQTNATLESKSFKNLYDLVNYLNQGMAFLLYLDENGVFNILQTMKPESQKLILEIDLKELLTTANGRVTTNELASALIDFTFKKFNNAAYVTDVLSNYCGQFCGTNDILLSKAIGLIQNARNAFNVYEAKIMLLDSLTILNRIAAHIPVNKARDIAFDFSAQKYSLYGVQFILSCIHARDPNIVTNGFIETGFPLNGPNANIFDLKKQFYDIVIELLDSVIEESALNSNIKELFDTAFGHDDIAFHYYVYEKFMSMSKGQKLISLSLPLLEKFLSSPPFTSEKLNLLSEYYKYNERFDEAAYTLVKLARFPDEKLNIDMRINYLTSAFNLAKSVTAPGKQYEMFQLAQEIDQLLELANQQSTASA